MFRRVGGSSLILVLLSGCGSGSYPSDLKYPLRSDPLVTLTPTEPAELDKPGDFFVPLVNNLTDEQEKNKIIHPEKISAQRRKKLEESLAGLFGTPSSPKVGEVEEPASELLKLDEQTLAKGSYLYRLHCLHCHGLTGDGRGPTAPWINPHPRDYRQGLFKFTSTDLPTGSRRPRRDDLLRTLREGLEGTAMPSFRLLEENDLDALASYVIHLSVRGEAEFSAMKYMFQDDSVEPDLDYFKSEGIIQDIVGRWVSSQEKEIKPGPYPVMNEDQRRESVRNGFLMFTQPGEAGCIGCHKDFGRKEHFMYDNWGTVTRVMDLTAGVYHGGRRPIDIYYRIHGGVNGTGMPGFARTGGSSAGLEPNQIWDLVNLVQILPYPKMREKYGINID